MSSGASLSGLQAAASELRIIGNNVANVATNGFKQSRAEFADVYAASVLGTGGNAIGTGVNLASVSQQFTQGTISSTENALDLAINGSGFFSLDKDGERLFTRAGAFSVDNEGNVVNSQGARLRGFLPDFTNSPEGIISGAEGTLQLDTTNIAPAETTSITTTLNLNSAQQPPSAPFSTGFTPSTPPAINTFNNSSSITVFDSQGSSHVLSMFFVKDDAIDNKWQMFIGIDGTDVTPTPSSGQPTPFSMVFDENGVFIPNDPAVPPVITDQANTASAVSSFVNAGALGRLDTGELTINGTAIPAAVSDGVSVSATNDDLASARSIANAITGSTVSDNTIPVTSSLISGLSVQTVAATVNLGEFTPPSSAAAFSSGDFVINGIDIIDTDGAGGTISTAAELVTAINFAMDNASTAEPLQASLVDGDVILTISNAGAATTADGRNIDVNTDGAGLIGANFDNFNLAALTHKVQRGSVSLRQTGADAITIAGTQSLDSGFTPGTSFAEVTHTNSDVFFIDDFDPANGAATQDITLDFSNSTQFGSEFALQGLLQNGSATGRLAGLDVDATGIFSARFTNGRSRLLGQTILTTFANEQGLQPQGDSNWSETFESGVGLNGAPQSGGAGAVQSGALEDSNVDLTGSLVGIVTAQKNFQANSQGIRADNEIIDSILSIL